jgi:hypothetical protein
MTEFNDLPAEEIIKLMKEKIEEGWICFVKWTCEDCGERVACNTANAFFMDGYTHEECGHTSHPDKFGLLIMGKIEKEVDNEEKDTRNK